MAQEPKLMTLLRMRDILASQSEDIGKQIYIDEHLAIIRGSVRLLQLIIRHEPPFTFDDRRLGLVVRGEATVNINLVDRRLTAGTLVFIGPGTIISPISFSPDFELYGFGIPADFALPCQLPKTLDVQVRDFQLSASESDIAIVRHILDTLWHVVHQRDYDLLTASCLVAAQLYHYDALYCKYVDQQQSLQSHEQTIFDRFLQLVNRHARQEHHIAFYARRMCLTERYLGTVVRQASGVTAKEWIDRALIVHIKIELRHTRKTIAQIADDMRFPNASFFNKYFKRLTGMTPVEFRNVIK